MGRLTAAQLGSFRREGFLVLPNLFPPPAVALLVEEISSFLEAKAADEHRAGRLTADDCASLARLPFDQRSARLCELLGEPPAHMPPTLSAVSSKSHTTVGMHSLMTHPSLLDVAASVIGEEVLVHPQFNMRGMLPQSKGVMWHQDLAFLEPECEPTAFANFWIPLQDITPAHGGLMVAPQSHAAGALPHVVQGTPLAPYSQVTLDMNACGGVLPGTGEPELVDTLPVGGGVLFTHKMLHSSRTNLSCCARWTLDIRYSELGMPTGRPAVPGFVGRSSQVAANTHEEWLAALGAGGSYLPLQDGGRPPTPRL